MIGVLKWFYFLLERDSEGALTSSPKNTFRIYISKMDAAL